MIPMPQPHHQRLPQPSLPVPVVGPATPADVPGITLLVNAYARRGDLLPRSQEAIAASIGDWMIATIGGQVIACGSLLMYSDVLAEVRSLAVAESAQGLGLGRQIVEALIDEARRRRVATLFALTRAVPFFIKMGFAITDKARFPQKVWNDCTICPLKEMCDEIAMVMSLTS